MSLFNQLLSNRNGKNHYGQAIWKYNLNDSEFNALRRMLLESKSLSNIDTRDCTLYYAEWWKRCYNDGLPSKRHVYNSIANSQQYDEEMFFQHAKKGANLLGIQWIKNQNTLYFRSLLLQGGLPIKHISNNRGAYKNFLLKILELNPKSIDDFAFNLSITSLLPPSSRNDEIFECCLKIVQAIINEDHDYLSILEGSQELKDIGEELRIKKQHLSSVGKKTRLRVYWVFEPDKENIRLYLGIPDMTFDDFQALILAGNQNEPLEYEYKLYYNDQIICKFIQKANKKYKIIWVNQDDITWNGTDQFSEIFIISSSGKKFNCQHIVSNYPNISKPTLWSKYSDAEWILEKGTHTKQDEGYVLVPNDYNIDRDTGCEDLTICGKSFRWVGFCNTLTAKKQYEHYQFKTNSKNIEWYISDQKPVWMQKPNLNVVRGKPRVFVYDETGNLVHNAKFNWKPRAGNFWSGWNETLPLGLLELKVQVGDIVEYDEFFNIGHLDIKVSSNNLHEAEIQLLNNKLSFFVNEGEFVGIEKISSDKIQLRLKSNDRIPNAIFGSIKDRTYNRGLRFEIQPPFRGVEIIDNEQNIVKEESILNLTSLNGYRLMTNIAKSVVNIYNTKRRNIILSEPLNEKLIPLRTFEDKINHLYTLSDPMDGEAEIVIEVSEEGAFKQTKIKEYRIKRYSQKINFKLDENNSLNIVTGPTTPDLYAVPLDCSYEQMDLRDLENNEGSYTIKDAAGSNKYIVFADKELGVKIQPAFISLDPENQLTTDDDRLVRILNYKDELLKAAPTDDVWSKLLTYYKICLKNDLSCSTFDILKASGFSSLLAAKTYLYLLSYDDTYSFEEDGHKKLEQDAGFCFHWVSRAHWEEAMTWINTTDSDELMHLLFNSLRSYFDNLYPNQFFNKISAFVLQSLKPKALQDFFLNGKIVDLRSSLGSRVLKELPHISPKVPEPYKNIIPINESNAGVKILLKSPLVVALSIAGKDDTLWSKDNEFIRRNVKYSYKLNPEWYSEAIVYSLTKI